MSLNAATKKLTIMTFHKITLCDLLVIDTRLKHFVFPLEGQV